MRKVCLVGAGYISHLHAEALRAIPNIELHSVVDINLGVAQEMARQWNIPKVFSSADEALAGGEIDCAHILTQANLHAVTARPFLAAGVPVLLEKPMAANGAECRELITLGRERNAAIGVSMNFVYHPAFVKLRRCVEDGRLGRPAAIDCIYNVAQMAVGQYGHWMFAHPTNMLLEKAVHPLSQIVALSGPLSDIRAIASPRVDVSPGIPFYGATSIMGQAGRVQAQLRCAVGQNFPFWQVAAICDDGVAVADILNNRFFTYERTRWLEVLDTLLSGTATATGLFGQSLRAAGDYVLSTAKIRPRSDGFYVSLKGSIAAYHRALDEKRAPDVDGAFGAHLVDICEQATASAGLAAPSPPTRRTQGDYDIAVLGGTGFIGTHVVKRLLASGLRVGVMARKAANLHPVFYDDRVVVVAGDARRQADVERAIGTARIVINLAHGGGGRNYEEMRAAMVGSAETVARACLAAKVERLLHVGSIAGLYLGPDAPTVTGATLPDPQPDQRDDYARAKAVTDTMLMTMQRQEGLPLCILRPGLVIGEGGLPFHSGMSFYNNDQHAIGWGRGNNPLPFVLVEDVADAVWLACQAPAAVGRAYNLVGDVRLTARQYTAELAAALQRPLRFHPKRTTMFWLQEVGKWLVKVAVGRKSPMPARRDYASRGLEAVFDCDDAKRDLGWTPTADRERFVARGIRVYAQGV